MTTAPRPEDPAALQTAMEGPDEGLAVPRLTLEGLVARFGQLAVLDRLSLALAPGECLALLGPSGCGKSTALALAAGLRRPDAGRVLLDGRPLSGPGRVGLMPQRDLLLPWRRLLDNLLLGPQLQGRPLAEARREALALLPAFGLEGFDQAYPAGLSGGMRQRAALLRTVLAGHRTLLLDEPFGALDALTRLALQSWLAAMRERFGWTVLLVTHSPEEALFLADRIAILGPRPARVVAEFHPRLPRPRIPSLRADPAFAAELGRLLPLILGPDGGFGIPFGHE